MAYKKGNITKVTIGADTIVGMGDYNRSGGQAVQMDTTAFTDNFESYEFGVKAGEDLTFSGLYDPDDTTGQEELQKAKVDGTDLTTLRFYIDNTSYFEACQTTGYFSPANTTGVGTELSHINIINVDTNSTRTDMMKISFSAKVSGVMVLV